MNDGPSGPPSRAGAAPTRGLRRLRAELADAGGPLYLGQGRRGWVTSGSERAALVLGPPRSGKTSAFVIPAVLAATGPVLTTSTKPDVLQATWRARAEWGQGWLFDPTGRVARPAGVEALRWSPVAASRTWAGALLTARCLVRTSRPAGSSSADDHWLERAESLLAPLFHAASLAGLATAEVVRWVNRRHGHDASAILDAASADAGDGATTGLAGDLLAGILATEVREQSGIWSTAASTLRAYHTDTGLQAAEVSDLDPAAFVAGSDTVYVCAPAHEQQLVAGQVVGLIAELRAAAYAAAAATAGARSSERQGAPFVLALDEVANIAPLPDLPATVAEGGGQGVLTLACLQDLTQARARWGQLADGFLSLFAATVILPGIGDVATLQAVSRLAGETDVVVRSTSRARTGRRSTTRSTRRQSRLPVDELSRGRPGQALVLRGGHPPEWFTTTPWYATTLFRDAVVGDAAPSAD